MLNPRSLSFEINLKKALFFGVFVHFIAVIFSEGFHRPDEHLGIMRYVSLKLGRLSPDLLNELSWEYPAKIRSWLQPGLYYLWSAFWELLGIKNPFSLALLMRLLSSAFSLVVTFHFVRFTAKLINSEKWRALYPYFAFLLWFFPFFHARTTAENFGANALMLALIFLLKDASYDVLQIKSLKDRPTPWSPKFHNALLGGLFLGLAANLRVPLVSIIPFVGMWAVFVARVKLIGIFACVLGILLSVGLTALSDYWGYGTWTYSTYNYFWWEFTKDVSSGFGVDPWWRYLEKINSRGIPPIGTAILISAFYFWFKKPWSIFTWTTASFFVAHSAIAHKELRYLFPMLPFVPLFLCFLLQKWDQHSLFHKKPVKIIIGLALVANFVAMGISSLRPAYAPMPTYKFLYHLEPPIEKIHTLGVIRDQLMFYLKKPIEQVLTETPEAVNQKIKAITSPTERLYFLGNQFAHYERLSARPSCHMIYSNIPRWLLESRLKKFLKRTKVWSIFSCGPA